MIADAVSRDGVSLAFGTVAFWSRAGTQGRWFDKDAGFDQAFRERFLDPHMAVAARRHDGWMALPVGAQDLSVQLNAELGEPWLDHAEGHRDIIRRFGRFPHRNPMLGRVTTLEEDGYLKAGGFQGQENPSPLRGARVQVCSLRRNPPYKEQSQMAASDLKIETRIGVKRKPRRILSVVSNTAKLQRFPVGFFAEEMTRAFLMFTEAGHRVDLASPNGGEVMFDTHSDPRTPGGAYADDLISLGFAHHEKFGAMLEDTLPISAVSVDDYDAVWVAGGGGPLVTFKDDTALHALIALFYEKGKIVTLICHGSALLLWTRLSNGKLLAEGKKWTGFTDDEEDEVNAAFGMTLNEYTIQSEAAGIAGTSFLCRDANEPFAVRDGRLITGQQQYSSAITAELVLEALDE